MARQIANLEKLVEAQQAADAAVEAVMLAAEKIGEAVQVSPGSAAQPPQQVVDVHVTAAVLRQTTARAALQGVAVGSLVEQAITEFLAHGSASKDAA